MSTIVCSDVDGWTPVRDGDVYCSPRCGFRCTWQAYQDAVAGANALCALLGAPGEWKPRVWENGGWHYEAGRGAATVSYKPRPTHAPQHRPRFECWLQVDLRAAGVPQNLYRASSPEDPRSAVHDALAMLRSDLDAVEREYAVVLAGTAPVGPSIAASADNAA